MNGGALIRFCVTILLGVLALVNVILALVVALLILAVTAVARSDR